MVKSSYLNMFFNYTSVTLDKEENIVFFLYCSFCQGILVRSVFTLQTANCTVFHFQSKRNYSFIVKMMGCAKLNITDF